MANDGKQLEELVAFVESQLVPNGFDVKTNHKLFEDGIQIAEFDVIVEGKIGTGSVKWLIECRNRPSEGAAPAAWIEQLAGRRQGHAFNKVTAVSATGFSAGAIAMANKMDVELRQVQALDPKSFESWMAATYIQQVERAANLTGATFLIGKHETEERRLAVDKYLKSLPDTPCLVQALTGNRVRLEEVFAGLVDAQGLFDDMNAGQPPKKVRIEAIYTSHDDFFYIDTELGSIKIETIQYTGELSIKETMVPILGHIEYASADGKEMFAQVAKARHVLGDGRAIGLSFHKMGAEGETLVSIQVEPKEAARRIEGGTAE